MYFQQFVGGHETYIEVAFIGVPMIWFSVWIFCYSMYIVFGYILLL